MCSRRHALHFDLRCNPLFQRIEHRSFRMPQIDCECHRLRNGVDRSRLEDEAPDGKANTLILLHHGFVQPVEGGRSGDHGIAAKGERRGAGMRGLPRQDDLEPSRPLNPVNDADGNALPIKGRPLLDVEFQIGGNSNAKRTRFGIRKRI